MSEGLRPISTAPKDRPVRLLCDDGEWRVGHWWKDDRWWLGTQPGNSYVVATDEPNPSGPLMTASYWEERR